MHLILENILGGVILEEKQKTKAHKLVLTSRKTALITGVLDVLSFDPGEVLLETEMGTLMIRGEELHVSRLDLEKGEVDVDGKTDSLTYSNGGQDSKNGESLLKKLFR